MSGPFGVVPDNLADILATGSDGPPIAVLAPPLLGRDESDWVLRQLMGALSSAGEVHLFTLGRRAAAPRRDGLVTVHTLAGATPATDSAAALVWAAVHRSGNGGPNDDIARVLGATSLEQWSAAHGELSALDPALVVVVDLRMSGALEVARRACPDTPLMLVPMLLDEFGATEALLTPFARDVAAAICFTNTEAEAVTASTPFAVHRARLPLVPNENVFREPHGAVGHEPYSVVLAHDRSGSGEPRAQYARLLQAAARSRLVAVYRDRTEISVDGTITTMPPAEGSSDIGRLMAWAQVTVDLEPGQLFARRCAQSQLYATAVVVPARSRAREYVKAGGGLGFRSAGEMVWIVDYLMSHLDEASQLGLQGQAAVASLFGSADDFITDVLATTSLGSVNP